MIKKSYQLKDGEYKQNTIDESRIWGLFNDFFSHKTYKNTAYKFIFMRSLLLNVDMFNSEYSIKYSELFETFTEIFWNIYANKGIKQSRESQKSKAEIEIDKILGNVDKKKGYNNIDPSQQSRLVEQIKKDCHKNVIGAVYEDFQRYIYSFSHNEEKLMLNPAFYDFIRKYSDILLKLNYLEWAKYMEKVNGSIDINGQSFLENRT
ncbi:hypothetical protein [Turicibacter sanguinis]|uniref:hypothetical protein n=1 Tax=Turicibacter sanguinis TaxID=154288 RepID=UPI0018AA05CA|nr:hypothetical protein [Turicibacter sanguinis]MDB8556973.1 hypothetical protein [Turicibacter sanguinis]MDB8559748.1 hypothetical protein [Turicibacter sanguinis]